MVSVMELYGLCHGNLWSLSWNSMVSVMDEDRNEGQIATDLSDTLAQGAAHQIFRDVDLIWLEPAIPAFCCSRLWPTETPGTWGR